MLSICATPYWPNVPAVLNLNLNEAVSPGAKKACDSIALDTDADIFSTVFPGPGEPSDTKHCPQLTVLIDLLASNSCPTALLI